MVFQWPKFYILLITFALCAISFETRALDVPSTPSGRVSDYAALLSNSTKQKLEKTLEDFEKTDSTQIAVAIFPSLEEESLEDFSMRLASTWQIGQKDHDNGVVFLIFKNDRQMRIEVGYGLEDKLTDATSSDIIRNIIVPEFKNGDFDAGVMNGVNAIIQATRGAYLGHSSNDFSVFEALMIILFSMAFFLFFIVAFIKNVAGRGFSSYSSSGWTRGSSGSFSSSGSSFSGGGGSFGGGGASGRW